MSSISPTEINRAFDPQLSVFVAANAGSGKTSLLVGRVLSLLLHGTTPHKILCLTYTNAAAAEMSQRIIRTLSEWVMMEENTLKSELAKFTPHSVDAEKIAFARSLFATVLDAPIGMQIKTIHGFCQSLLARFPLEAGVGTHLTIMDDHTSLSLMRDAKMALFQVAAHHNSELKASIYYVVQHLGEWGIHQALNEIIKQKKNFSQLIEEKLDYATCKAKSLAAFSLPPDSSFEKLMNRYLQLDDAERGGLKTIISILDPLEGKKERALCSALSQWVTAPIPDEKLLAVLLSIFITQKGAAIQSIVRKSLLPENLHQLLNQLQGRIIEGAKVSNNLENALLTSHLTFIASSMLQAYEMRKNEQGLMDFDDQIMAATKLLTQSHMAAWVLYKLDGGIDHLLVDEAQDTSPKQWQIIRALTDEFLSGQGTERVARSLFVVGDYKQSIFRFQGADPEGFRNAERYFTQKLDDAGLPYATLALTHSYRSAPEILQLVDTVFQSPDAAAGVVLPEMPLIHYANRLDEKGYLEYWPLAKADVERHRSAQFQLAENIADQIESWTSNYAWLEAKQRNVKPGDIMVLVRTRNTTMYALARSLKRRNIAVAGVDRVHLLGELIIHDLLAFAEILLFPEDDLMLAALLKSPLFGITEEALLRLCNNRKSSLWQILGEQLETKEHYELLAYFRSKVDYISPYELFSQLLEKFSGRVRITGRMGEEMSDLLDEFLDQILLFEQENPPSMQLFLGWMRASESEIKRDMEQAGDAVRIMTVHGAKGLQSPIVILADTTSLPSQKEHIYWPDNMQMPLMTVNTQRASEAYIEAKAHKRAHDMDEYRRLLYVALTRAEDWLIVCGAEHRGSAEDGSWYRLCEPAFKALGGTDEAGKTVIGKVPQYKKSALLKESEYLSAAINLPGIAPAETLPERPLSPSRVASDVPASLSPTIAQEHIQRGIAMHRVLQHIPHLEKSERHKAAIKIAVRYAPLLISDAHQSLVSEALAVIDDERFAPIFSPSSLAEAPISGVVEWKGKNILVSGQIDRLWIGEKELWIVDFKSAAQPPKTLAIPTHYIEQMALYKALLQKIYPNHLIHCALLWTSIARLDIVPSKQLDEVAAEAYI